MLRAVVCGERSQSCVLCCRVLTEKWLDSVQRCYRSWRRDLIGSDAKQEVRMWHDWGEMLVNCSPGLSQKISFFLVIWVSGGIKQRSSNWIIFQSTRTNVKINKVNSSVFCESFDLNFFLLAWKCRKRQPTFCLFGSFSFFYYLF